MLLFLVALLSCFLQFAASNPKLPSKICNSLAQGSDIFDCLKVKLSAETKFQLDVAKLNTLLFSIWAQHIIVLSGVDLLFKNVDHKALKFENLISSKDGDFIVSDNEKLREILLTHELKNTKFFVSNNSQLAIIKINQTSGYTAFDWTFEHNPKLVLIELNLPGILIDGRGLHIKGNNALPNINLTNFNQMKELLIEGNNGLENITLIDIKEIRRFEIKDNNNLKKINLTSSLVREKFQIESIIIRGNKKLSNISLKEIDLQELHIKGNEKLKEINFTMTTNGDEFIFESNKKLKKISLRMDELRELRIKDNEELKEINFTMTKGDDFLVESNKKLTKISLRMDELRELHIKGNEELKEISNLEIGQLGKLKIEENSKMFEFNLTKTRINRIERLTLKGNSELSSFKLDSKKELKELEIDANPKIKKINLTDVDIFKIGRLSIKNSEELTEIYLNMTSYLNLQELNIERNEQLSKITLEIVSYLDELSIIGNSRLRELDLTRIKPFQKVQIRDNFNLERVKWPAGLNNNSIYMEIESNPKLSQKELDQMAQLATNSSKRISTIQETNECSFYHPVTNLADLDLCHHVIGVLVISKNATGTLAADKLTKITGNLNLGLLTAEQLKVWKNLTVTEILSTEVCKFDYSTISIRAKYQITRNNCPYFAQNAGTGWLGSNLVARMEFEEERDALWAPSIFYAIWIGLVIVLVFWIAREFNVSVEDDWEPVDDYEFIADIDEMMEFEMDRIQEDPDWKEIEDVGNSGDSYTGETESIDQDLEDEYDEPAPHPEVPANDHVALRDVYTCLPDLYEEDFMFYFGIELFDYENKKD